ncbi:polysaccharide deacetylase family protein [Pseudarthrobacter sp. LMD1-1-1.1]|uniref:polysaccharide deacetylase family protein n=1 Tax=Pseudarthrobacter sp. LMD1-1-1.1 TaxID=3135242 RepID=UPI003434085C
MRRQLVFSFILVPLIALGSPSGTATEVGKHPSFPGNGGFSRGLVSVTFDDGWVSQYVNAHPVLRETDIPATYYITSGCVDADPACMTHEQIRTLEDQGDEIGSHSQTHPHMPTLSAAERNVELADSRTTLRRMFGPTVAANFAAPFGEYDDLTIGAAKRYYGSQRTTDSGFNTKAGFNRYRLVGQNVLAHTPSDLVRGWIESAKANGYWLILVYHEVGENRNGGVFHIDTATFRDQMLAIRNSGLAAVTVAQGLEESTFQLIGSDRQPPQ